MPSLAGQARSPPACPAPPGPTAHCGHSPRAWQCAEPFAGSIPLFRTGNNARKERMLSFPTCRRTTRSTRSVRNKNLVNFRKAAAPLLRYCKIPAGLISLLSAHLASQLRLSVMREQHSPHLGTRCQAGLRKPGAVPLAGLCCRLVFNVRITQTEPESLPNSSQSPRFK